MPHGKTERQTVNLSYFFKYSDSCIPNNNSMTDIKRTVDNFNNCFKRKDEL